MKKKAHKTKVYLLESLRATGTRLKGWVSNLNFIHSCKISIFLLLLILIFSTLSVYGQSVGKVQEYKLDNGMKVLIQEVHAAPVVSVFVWYRVGSRNENVGTTGISHQLEHMLFKGTKTFKPGEIDKLLNRAGAENNAFTTADFTAYFETLPSSNLELALKIEADRMVNSVIDPQELKHEKTVVLSELEGDENNPWFNLYEEVVAAAYKAHPYQWPVIGWKCDVLNYTKGQVYRYYKEFYKPENAVLVIVGDINSQKALALAKKYFEKIPSGGPVPQIICQEPAQQGERRVIVKKEGTTTFLHVAYHIPAIKDPDLFPLSIMDSVLTGGRSSRLYKALVETELAAEVGSWVDRQIDPTLFYVTVVLRPGVSTEKVEQVLYAELEKLKKEPISDLEFQKAVNQVNSSFIYARDSVTSQAETLGYFETLYTYKYIDTFTDNLKKVKKEDIMRVAEKYLTAENRTVGIFIPLPPKNPESLSAPVQVPGPARYKENSSLVSTREKSKKPDKKSSPEKKTVKSTFAKKISKAPVSKVKTEKPVRVVMENGIVLLIQENHVNPTVSISGLIKAGSMYDPADKAGLANFTASLLERGTKTRTSQQIASDLDFIGATLNFSGSRERMNFGGLMLSQDFEKVISILADELQNPVFPQEEIKKVRGELITAVKMEEDDPRDRAFKKFLELAYTPESPFHYDPLGSEDTLNKITPDDIAAFHEKYYRPDTMIIAVAGDIDKEKVIELVKKNFGGWKKEGVAPLFHISPVDLPKESIRKVINMPGKSQVEIVIGSKGLSRTNPDYYAAVVMNYILGENTLGSRMGLQIRDKEGLAYGVSSYFTPSIGEGPWSVRMGVNPKNVERAIAAVIKEMKRIQDSPVTDEELDDAKKYLIGRLPVSLERNSGIASMLITEELYGLGLDFVEKFPKIYQSITKEQVQKAAKKYLHPDRYVLVIAGPYEEKK